MQLFASVLNFCFFAFATQAQQYPDPQPCTGACDRIQDISVVRHDDGTYYRFAAHLGIQIATSKTLSGPWIPKSRPVFPNWLSFRRLMPAIIDTWSPDVHKIGDTYYLFYTVENFGTNYWGWLPGDLYMYANIAVATSKTLEPGSWVNNNLIGLKGRGLEYTRIGPSVLVDGENMYMAFGSYAQGIFGTALQNPPAHVLNDYTTMLTADEKVPSDRAKNRTEASSLWKNNGFYYLFYSSGNCCPGNRKNPGAEYKIKVCRSTTALGKYYAKDGTSCLSGDGGTIVLQSHGDVYAPGSSSIMEDPIEGTVMVYQYMSRARGLGEPNIRMGWNHLVFENGWPVLQ